MFRKSRDSKQRAALTLRDASHTASTVQRLVLRTSFQESDIVPELVSYGLLDNIYPATRGLKKVRDQLLPCEANIALVS